MYSTIAPFVCIAPYLEKAKHIISAQWSHANYHARWGRSDGVCLAATGHGHLAALLCADVLQTRGC